MSEKQAGGDILGRLAGLVSRPFVGPQKSQAIQQKVVGGITNRVNQPIETALRRTGVHKAISKAYEYGSIPVPGTPKLLQPVMPFPEQRRAYGNWRADDIVHTVSQNPEIIGALASPIPGTAETYLAGKHLLGRALGGGVKKLAQLTPSFADEVEKLANGDMLEYFRDHPEKAEARKKLGKPPIPLHLSTALVKTAAPKVLIKKKMVEETSHHCPGCGEELPERGGVRWNRDDNTFTHVKCGTTYEYEKRDSIFSKTAEVSPYQQKTQWTCSAACLKAVMGHWGVDVPELEVIKAVGAQKGRGAECDQIAAAARQFGFLAFEHSFESLEQAGVLLDQDIPIICDIQSFNNPGKGHYVVLTGIDDQVHLMDPNTPGNLRDISLEEMDQRWWDRAMAPPHDLMPKWGIIVVPPEGSDDSPQPNA